MKKYALVMALALAASLAQADVAVYGKVRQYMDNDKVGTASGVTALTNDTSRIGFKASEKLSNGLTATAVFETGVGADAPAATTFGDRESTVGLAGNGFAVRAGRAKHSYDDAVGSFSPIDDYAAFTSTVHVKPTSRIQNAVFGSANVGPATVRYDHGLSEVAGGTDVQSGSAAAKFGPVAVGAARHTGSGSDYTAAGASYNAGFATVYGLWSEKKTAGAVANTGKSVGVAVPVTGTPVTVKGSYGINTADTKAYNLAATYAFSKTVLAHAVYRKENAVLTSADRQQFGVGLEYNF
jgi:predicted porin